MIEEQKQECERGVEKVLIAGIDNAGKSSIQDILRFTPTEAALRRVPSNEIEIFDKVFLKKKYVFFIPPGQEDLRLKEFHGAMRANYFEQVSVFIFVIDSSDKTRFREAQEELQRSIEDLLEITPHCHNFLLFAHKQDIEDAGTAMAIKEQILDPLKRFFPVIVSQFKIYETTILAPESIHEPFVKAIAKHVGIQRIDFDKLADWIRKQTRSRFVLISDANGLLIGEAYTGAEDPIAFAAYMAKLFSATDDFQRELKSQGFQTILLEEEDGINYSLISRVNCSRNDYLALLIGRPKEQIGLTRIINRKGLAKLREEYNNYR